MAAPVQQPPTRVEDVEADATGWVNWRGHPTLVLPARDRSTGLFARLKFGPDSVAAAKKLGATIGRVGRLLTEAEFWELHRTPGVREPSPTSLTMDADELAEAQRDGIALYEGEGDNRKPTKAHLNRHSQWMSSLKWFKRHDDLFLAKLAGLPAAPGLPVSNAGKNVLHPDGVVNFGWFLKAPTPQYKSGIIQSAGHQHGPGHYDYSQLLLVTTAPPPGSTGGIIPGGGGGGPVVPANVGPLTKKVFSILFGAGAGAALGYALGGREASGAGIALGAVVGLVLGPKEPTA